MGVREINVRKTTVLKKNRTTVCILSAWTGLIWLIIMRHELRERWVGGPGGNWSEVVRGGYEQNILTFSNNRRKVILKGAATMNAETSNPCFYRIIFSSI